MMLEKDVKWMNMLHNTPMEFQVWCYQTGAFREVSEKDLMGHWSILFFYPADFSFVCPTELGDLADHYAQFREEDCEIYSISEDTHFVHKAWADASKTIQKVQYPMLADPAGCLARQYGVLDEKSGQAYRGVFILNPKGQVVSYEMNDMGIGRSADEILRKLQAARFVAEHGDQVCPAKWHPGEPTLTPSLDLVGML
jgi:peroxiredoxin (alkyl hydroperoxide reductase subunit C)